MHKNKVCILTTVHSAFDIRIYHKQAKTLARAGYDVTLITNHDRKEEVDGIKIIPLPKAKNRFERMFVNSFRAFLIAFKHNADIYHFHDPELYLMGAFLKIFTGKPVISDAHEHYEKDILGKEWLSPQYRRTYLFFFKIFERISLPFLDAIVYVVPDIGDRYKKLGFKGKFVEVRNYPDLSILNIANDNNDKNPKQAIFFGGVFSVSGISELVKSFIHVTKTIPDARLDIIGKTAPVTYKDELLNLIKEYQLENNVFLHDPVPITELNKFASSASIGLITYLPVTENNVIGLPNKIFEYMAFKLAVIASDFPLYKEVVIGSNAGFTVDPTSPEDIAEKLITLMQNPNLCKDFAESGYQNVMKTYNWENESQKLLNLYDDLLTGKK